MKIATKIFIGIFITSILFLVVYLKNNIKNNTEKSDLVIVQKRDIINKICISGLVEPSNEIVLKSSLSGILEELYVETGEKVKIGDPIAKIKILADPENLELIQKSCTISRLKLELAKKTYTRTSKLLEKGLVSKTEFEQVEQEFILAKEEYLSSQNQFSIIKKGFVNGQKDITNIVTSTINGTIMELPLKVGSSVIERNNFNEGTSIAMIADLTNFIFKGKITEKDIQYLTEKIEFNIKLNSAKNKEYTTVLTKISPKGENENGITKFDIEGKIQINKNDFFILRAGYSAVAEMVLSKAMNVIAIKEEYILFENESTYIWVLENDKRFKRKIKTGVSDGIYIEIIDGVTVHSKILKK